MTKIRDDGNRILDGDVTMAEDQKREAGLVLAGRSIDRGESVEQLKEIFDALGLLNEEEDE